MKYKPIIHCDWKLTSTSEFDEQIEIFVDEFPTNNVTDNIIRIILIQESYNTDWIITKLRNFPNYYTYVFTYNQDILDSNPKAIKYLGINTWIRNDYDFPPKKFGVSTVVGGKHEANLEGHFLRHNLWNRQNEIKMSKDFYLSSVYKYKSADYNNNLVLGSDKSIMFNNQYHIAIENTRMKNMFTEKLIDCFQTKTIPIYYGCSNLDEYFNMDGIYLVKNIDEIINVCNDLTSEIYNNKINSIEENYNLSMSYLSHTQILDRKLNELINKNK